jgi:5-formyltetrahydrofolate cyclo-ligase
MRTEPQISPLHTAALAQAKTGFVIPPTLRHEAELELSFAPDLVLVPGLAFSTANHRLGRGGGFYDRLLAGRAAQAFKLAVCFRFQVLEAIAHEAHDMTVDAIITD